jgi:hypothetical protein
MKYILSIKYSPCVEEFFIKEVNKFNPLKHGIEKMRIELDDPTQKQIRKELDIFMKNWSFMH